MNLYEIIPFKIGSELPNGNRNQNTLPKINMNEVNIKVKLSKCLALCSFNLKCLINPSNARMLIIKFGMLEIKSSEITCETPENPFAIKGFKKCNPKKIPNKL